MTDEIMPKCGQFYKRAEIGDVFGRLTILSFEPEQSCRCRCACGIEKIVKKYDLEHTKTRSCGCHKNENTALRNKSHGHSQRGRKHPLYNLWSSMMNRCNNPGNKDYGLYGGRGIHVTARWHDFTNFLADMGERPSKRHSLDRFPDKDGNYEPGNVRWATDKQQARNCRDTMLINGEPLQDVAERLGLSPNTLKSRLRYSMTGERLLFPGRYKTGPRPKD